MRRSRTLIVLGIFVGLSPFFGLPYNALMWFLPAVGFLIVVVGACAAFEKTNERKSNTNETEHPPE